VKESTVTTQSLVVVPTTDKEFTYHVHSTACADRKKSVYKTDAAQEAWDRTLAIAATEQIVRNVYADAPDWTDQEDQFKIFDCVDTDQLVDQVAQLPADEQTVAETVIVTAPESPVKAPEKAVAAPEQVAVAEIKAGEFYAISGVLDLKALNRLSFESETDPVAFLASIGLKIRLSTNKTLAPKVKEPKTAGNFKNLTHVAVEVKSEKPARDKVLVSIPGTAARAVNLTEGAFQRRGRGDQYLETVTVTAAIKLAKTLQEAAQVIIAQPVRSLEDWGLLNSLDRATGRIIDVL
jgi:hypothetical protein